MSKKGFMFYCFLEEIDRNTMTGHNFSLLIDIILYIIYYISMNYLKYIRMKYLHFKIKAFFIIHIIYWFIADYVDENRVLNYL